MRTWVTMDAVRQRADAMLWAAYLLAPAPVGGLIHGIPLGPVDAFALLALAWLVANGRRVPGGLIVVSALLVSVVVSVSIPGREGFRARYFANAAAEGPFEPGTEFPRGNYTRIDERLDFAPGGRELPLAFFNDIDRFNFYLRDQPSRDKLAFAADWSGYVLIEGRARVETLYLFVPQASGHIQVDLKPALVVADGLHTAAIEWTPGWHRVDVHLSSPYGAPRRFSAGVVDAGERRPFDASMVVTRQIRAWQMKVARVTRIAKIGVDLAVLTWLTLLVAGGVVDRIRRLRDSGALSQRSPVLSLLSIVGIVEACHVAWPWASRLMVMRGGDDPMTYEFYARDILLHGPLMTLGRPLGQGDPYYYQVFYPYVLACVHAVFGEGMFGVMLIQRLFVVFVIWALLEIAVQLVGEAVWQAALIWAAFFTYWKFAPIAADLLSEAVFIPVVLAWALSLLAVGRLPTLSGAVRAGLLGGVAAMTRSTTLAAWPAVVPMCWVGWKHAARRRLFVVAMVACSVGLFSLITVRNAVVAHTLVSTPTGLGVTLLSGNEPPADMTFDLTTRGALYDRFGLNEFTRKVVEYAIQRPFAFALNMARKSLFALGFYEIWAPGWGVSPVYILGWAAAILGLFVVWRADRLPVSVAGLPALIGLMHVASVVVVYPKGERLILPFHMLMAPYSCIGFDRIVRRMWKE